MKDGAPQSAATESLAGGGLAVATAVSPTATSAAVVAAVASAATAVSSPGHANAILQLGDMGTPADVAAEMELLHTANRDMFSWLLFNSENMSAPGSGGIDDPFRMLGSHDDSNSSSSAPNSSSGPLTFLSHAHVTDPLHHHGHNAHSAPSTGHATATAGSLQVSVQMNGGSAADKLAAAAVAAAKKRGKKRLNDSPVHVPQTTPTARAVAVTTPAPKKQLTGKENLNGTPMSATQEGLLRHLESANHALAQKRQQFAAVAASASAATSLSSGLSTPKAERASSSGSDDTLSTLQRKQKLERNRESARECRRRKREHILGVEERCRQLERENMELRGQLKAGKEAMKLEEKEKNRVCEELEQMIQRGASEKELAEKIDNFKEQYSDYGHGRRSALSYHLHQIERLLLPTQVTKMCIWALRQDDSFWQDEEDETSLPVILAKELGLSEEQKKKIQQQRCVESRSLSIEPSVGR